MSNLWVLDVLKDLRAFSTQNGYPKLAEQLDDVLLVAADELTNRGGRARERQLEGHEPTVRVLLGAAGAGEQF